MAKADGQCQLLSWREVTINMVETFWDKYRVQGGMSDFIHVSEDCNRVVKGHNIESEGTYMLEVVQKYGTDHILFSKDSECIINGKNTGKKCWVSDISFSMTADMFGGIILILTDGDYLTIRMDGKITSFMSIPFENLSQDKNDLVRRTVAEYGGNWKDFV